MCQSSTFELERCVESLSQHKPQKAQSLHLFLMASRDLATPASLVQVTPVRVSVRERKARLAARGIEPDAELQVGRVCRLLNDAAYNNPSAIGVLCDIVGMCIAAL